MRHVVSLAIITNPEGEYLLQFRDALAPSAPSQWSLFGGHKEGNEKPLDTLMRELREELDLSFTPERFMPLGSAETPDADIYLYRLSLLGEEGNHIHLGEGGAFRFFPSKEEVLRLPMPPSIRELFEKAA